MVAFEREKCGLENGVTVYNFLGIDEKTKRNLLLAFNQNIHTVYSNNGAVYPNKKHVTAHPDVLRWVLHHFPSLFQAITVCMVMHARLLYTI